MNTLTSSTTSLVRVHPLYSRSKAIQVARKAGVTHPVPHEDATGMIYLMFMKIGGTKELPSNENLKDSYLNDFWLDFYFNNHLCPADIPFHILIKEFTTAMVQGRIERKGNNQGAICEAFNKWVTREDVRNKLYQKRDQMYPELKPKQIPKRATEETVQDYSDLEIVKKYYDIKPMAGIAMVDAMIKELQKEISRRGLDHTKHIQNLKTK